ncbi:MAG TPA: TonB-dependent receptor, partial [Casimicrobiaceae bacterium]|nr:TonB-dependent receptor [Casimicrobiaceae bacterium]
WNIKHKNIIDQPLIQFQLANPDAFPNSIIRDTRTARDIAVGAPGALRGAGSDLEAGLFRLYFNIAQQKAEGIDVSARYRHDMGDWGRLTSQLEASYNITYKFAAAPGQPLQEFNGTYRYPRWRGNLTLDWERGPWNTTVFVNYIHHYLQQNVVPNTPRDVDTWTTTDLQLQYKGFKNWTLAGGIKNLFDRDPPFSNQETQGYDFTTHNPVGRFFYGRVKYAFQ